MGYDANGNIQNDGVAAYIWNGRNQLISRGSTSFQYDSYGRRTLNAAGNKLLYEGWNAGQELSGTTPVANRILGGIDEFFNRTDSTGAYSPIIDALGSILALTNSSGNITTQYGYDPFGNTTVSGGTSTNVFQYTGRENDGNGLYSYRARYDSPAFGRFVSEDSIGFGGGQTNLHAYVYDNPTNMIDPLGLAGMAGRNCGNNPCKGAGRAPDPRVYRAKGQAAQTARSWIFITFSSSVQGRPRCATTGSVTSVRKLCVRGLHECCGIHSQSGSGRSRYLCAI